MRLESGKIAFRLQAGSTTVLDTPQGAARLPATQPASTGGTQYEALIEYSGGTTSLQAYRGDFELVAAGDIATPVESGQRATLAPNSTTPTIVLADASSSGTPPAVADSDDSNQKKAGAAESSLPFGLSPLWATVIGVGALAAIGGGIAAATSGGGGGSSNDASTGGGNGNQGSPFRATRTASD